MTVPIEFDAVTVSPLNNCVRRWYPAFLITVFSALTYSFAHVRPAAALVFVSEADEVASSIM